MVENTGLLEYLLDSIEKLLQITFRLQSNRRAFLLVVLQWTYTKHALIALVTFPRPSLVSHLLRNQPSHTPSGGTGTTLS